MDLAFIFALINPPTHRDSNMLITHTVSTITLDTHILSDG